MKRSLALLAGLWLSFVLAAPALAQGDCSKAEEYAGNALLHAKRTYNASSVEEARFCAKNLISASEDARKAAAKCNCPDAEGFADETYECAVKAYEAQTLEETQSHAKNAIGAAEDALKAAVDCNE